MTGPARPGTLLLVTASGLLLLLAAAQGYVSWWAQYTFVLAAKHAPTPAALEALGLDTAAVIFALLALARARLGKSAAIERVLNLACALGSLTMNVLAADLGSPRSVVVYVLPSALYAACSDRLIAVVRDRYRTDDGRESEGSVWHLATAMALWALRLVLAPPSTAGGFRRWVLGRTPLPPSPKVIAREVAAVQADAERELAAARAELERVRAEAAKAIEAVRASTRRRDDSREITQPPARPGTKKAALLALYEDLGRAKDPRFGDRDQAARVAAELAPQVDLDEGAARTYLYRYLTVNPTARPATDAEGSARRTQTEVAA